jgi:hypothetical protein
MLYGLNISSTSLASHPATPSLAQTELSRQRQRVIIRRGRHHHPPLHNGHSLHRTLHPTPPLMLHAAYTRALSTLTRRAELRDNDGRRQHQHSHNQQMPRRSQQYRGMPMRLSVPQCHYSLHLPYPSLLSSCLSLRLFPHSHSRARRLLLINHQYTSTLSSGGGQKRSHR